MSFSSMPAPRSAWTSWPPRWSLADVEAARSAAKVSTPTRTTASSGVTYSTASPVTLTVREPEPDTAVWPSSGEAARSRNSAGRFIPTSLLVGHFVVGEAQHVPDLVHDRIADFSNRLASRLADAQDR